MILLSHVREPAKWLFLKLTAISRPGPLSGLCPTCASTAVSGRGGAPRVLEQGRKACRWSDRVNYNNKNVPVSLESFVSCVLLKMSPRWIFSIVCGGGGG